MSILEDELDIMAALKSGTAESHRRIERLMPFFDDQLSPGRYRATLYSFLGFFAPMERRLAAIAGWETTGLDPVKRRRSHLLRADLQALGMPESEIAATPESCYLPTISNCADGLGCLYVLEGSTLGGQLIAQEVQRKFGIAPVSGVSFFSSHGVGVGAMWREFGRIVRAHVNTAAKRTAALQAATETFQTFESWIRRANDYGE